MVHARVSLRPIENQLLPYRSSGGRRQNFFTSARSASDKFPTDKSLGASRDTTHTREKEAPAMVTMLDFVVLDRAYCQYDLILELL